MGTPQPKRIAISLTSEDRARVYDLAERMRMRPATYLGWLVSNIVQNLEAAETVAEALSSLAHTIPPMDAPKKAGKKNVAPEASLGRRKGSHKGARRGRS